MGTLLECNVKYLGVEKLTNYENCACTHYAQEKAKYVRTKSSLVKVKCAGCGKDFLTNIESEKSYCFDCKDTTN